MSKFYQKAPTNLRTAKQIVDSLVNGQRELSSFSELYDNTLTQDVLHELLSRIRPLTLEVGQLRCKLDRFVMEHNNYAASVTGSEDRDDEDI